MKVMRNSINPNPGGFTLLEVMVALAVISISLIVLLQAQNANVLRSYHSKCLTRAALLSRKIISEIDSGGAFTEGEWEGREESDGVIFTWKKVIEPSVIDEMKKITVTITWGADNTAIPFVLETYRAASGRP